MKVTKKISFFASILLVLSMIVPLTPPVLVMAEAINSDADLAFNSFNSKFYTVSNGNGYYKADVNGGQAGFWTEAEMIEMTIDAYDRTGNVVYKNMITELCNGFINKWGNDWQSNIYNDDIMWICIAFLRAYKATGNTTFMNMAKDQFDKTYNRAWSSDLGGGLWWTTNKNEKNACVNGPGAIASYLLFEITKDSSYLTKATNMYNWEKSTLFDSSTGGVNDNISKTGILSNYKSTYNQGTFIGIASYLYKQTGNVTYLNDAKKSADFTKNSLCNSIGILPDEYGTNDLPGFKGIFARWICMLIKNSGQTQYTEWLQKNVNAAWKIKNSNGLMWSKWGLKTPDSNLQSWECSSAVVLMQLCPGATFYQNSDFAGTSVSIPKGDYSLNQLQGLGIPNDWVSSLKVPNGITVEVYQNDNFTGTKWTFKADSNYVGSTCNDQMSSVKIFSTGPTFYENANYTGTAITIPKGNYTLKELQGLGIPNDWVSSIKVPSGITVDIYQNDNFTGTKWIFSTDSNYVGSTCNDAMTSVKIY